MSKFRPNIAVSCVLFAVFLYALGLVFAKTQKSVPNASATFLPTSNSHSMWGGLSNTVDAAKSSEQDTCFKGNRAHLSAPKNVKETFAPSKGGSADGVTALDLLLINKHVQHIERLASPYQWIAADVDNSGVVTAADIVHLRKLILGVCDTLPDNRVRLFVPKTYVFPDPANPLIPYFSRVPTLGATDNPQDFVGIKIGDVNNSVAPRQSSEPAHFAAAPTPLQGNFLDVPLRLQNEAPLTALQAAFRFDPEAVEFVGVAQGDVRGVTPDCFGLTRLSEGLVRLVWLSTDPESAPLRKGQTLCHFTFKPKRALRTGESPLWLAEGDLEPEGFNLQNARFALHLSDGDGSVDRAEAVAPLGRLEASAVPNPSTGEVFLRVASQAEGRARVFVFDAFGRRALYREAALAKGDSQIPLEGFAALPSGVYTWVFLLGTQRMAEGRLVKQ